MYDLKPLRYWCQKILPLVYDGSLSVYELLCKVVDYLNKTMSNFDELNSEYADLKVYVDDYFKNLDIQDSVRQVINELVENGVIEGELQNVANTYKGTISPNRIWRYKTKGTSGTVFLQGNCRTPHGIMCAYFDYSRTTDDVLLIEFSLDGNELRRQQFVLGHANGMCYNPDNNTLYVVPNQHYDTTDFTGVYAIPYDTLSTSTYIDNGIRLSGIAYDKKTQKMYMSASGGGLYEITNTETMTGTLKFYFSINYNVSHKPTMQTIGAYDNRIYVMTVNPLTLCSYSLTGEQIQFFKIAEWEGVFFIGEIEGFDFDLDGTVYFMSITGSNRYTYWITQCWTWNLYKQTPVTNVYYTSRVTPLYIYIVENATSNNPDGTSANPFDTWTEAYIAMKSHAAVFREIYASGNHSDEAMYLDNQSIYVHGQNSSWQYGFFVNCSNVFISDTTFNSYLTSPYYCIEAVNSNVYLQNITYNVNSNNTRGVIYNNNSSIDLQAVHTFNNKPTTTPHIYWNSSIKPTGISAKRDIEIISVVSGSGWTQEKSVNSNSYTVDFATRQSIENNAYSYALICLKNGNVNQVLYLHMYNATSTRTAYTYDGSTVSYNPDTGVFSSDWTIQFLVIT